MMKKYLLATACLFFCGEMVYAADDIELDNTMGAALKAIGALAANELGFTGSGVTVGVVNSGIDLDHTEFTSRIVKEWSKDFVESDPSDKDLNGCGTHAAGIIAAAKNGKGMRGVAYGASVAAERVLDSDGSGYTDDIDSSYAYLNTLNDIKIINNSFSGSILYFDGGVQHTIFHLINSEYLTPAPAQEQTLKTNLRTSFTSDEWYGSPNVAKAALEHDKVLVVSAGENGYFQPDAGFGAIGYAIPEAAQNMLVAVAYDASEVDYDDKTTYTMDKLASFSNLCGQAADYCLAAPGFSIYSTYKDHDYALKSGTTTAAAMVSGALALVYQAFPGMTAAQLTETVKQTAIKELDIYLTSGQTFSVTKKDDIDLDGQTKEHERNLTFAEYVGQGFLDVGSAVKGPKHFTGNADGVYAYNAPAGTVSTFAQDIDGADGYTQTGKGDVYFTGNNTYAGESSINGGGFYVTGSVASNVTASSGAKVGGDGTIDGNLKVNGGTVDLTKTGTTKKLTVTGAFVSNNADLLVNIDASGAAMLDIAGHAVINGGSVVLGDGFAPSAHTKYTVMTAGDDIEGDSYATAEVHSLYMFLDAVTETVGNRVIVNVGEAVNVNELPGLAPNQQKIADAYRELQENDINVPLTSKLYRYSASSPAVRETLSELSGTIYASELASRSVGKTVSNMFARIKNVGKKTESAANEFWNERDFYQVAQGYGADIYKPRTSSPSEDKTVKTAFATGDAKGGIWMQPYGGHAKVKSDISAGMASSRTSLYGVQGGADAFVGGGKILLGGALAFGHGRAKQGNAKIDVNDYRFGGYAGTEIGKMGLRGSASVGYQDYDGERGLSLYGITASSDYSGYNINLSFDGDVKLYENDGLALRLIFGAEMTYERTRSFTESGAAGLSLVVDGNDNTLFNAKAGFGIAKHTDTYGIEADLYYRNLLVGYDRDMTARFTGGGSVFKLDGYDYDRNVGGLELSFYVKATDNLYFYADATSEISKDTKSVLGTIGLKYSF